MTGRTLVLTMAVVVAAVRAADTPELLRLPTIDRSGAEVSLGDVLGDTPAVVVMLATYCPPCRAEVPALNGVAKSPRKGAPVRIVGVFVDVDEPKGLARVAQEWDIGFDVRAVPPAAEEAARALLPRGLPATFTVRGRDVVRHDRVLDAERLGSLLDGLAAEPAAAAR